MKDYRLMETVVVLDAETAKDAVLVGSKRAINSGLLDNIAENLTIKSVGVYTSRIETEFCVHEFLFVVTELGEDVHRVECYS